ncbi:hypothetical protein [Methanosarcina spelaei]|nr:hypothetical protein [Methanosarcina spelaei]
MITYYSEESKTGYTMEKYIFIDPKVIKEEGVVSRLEKCEAREGRTC